MKSITPYTIAIPQADLDDLKERLARIRWSNELPGMGSDYGVSLDPIKRLVKYWRESYDWRTWEAKLNAYPQFTTTIDGQNIHFLHVRSPEDNALPLILTHGWPMSVVDYLNLIGPLSDPRSHAGDAAQAFHLVIPSLPGFGFSGPTKERGWDRFRVACAWAELMRSLGYDRYGAQGMDWGSIISPEVGRFDPELVVGVHVTEIFSSPSGDLTELETLSDQEKKHWQSFLWWIENKGAYNSLQSTVPQTLAHAPGGFAGRPACLELSDLWRRSKLRLHPHECDGVLVDEHGGVLSALLLRECSRSTCADRTHYRSARSRQFCRRPPSDPNLCGTRSQEHRLLECL